MLERVFTAGHASVYDEALSRYPSLCKIGRREPSDAFPQGYVGGWVFRTREDAVAFAEAVHPEVPFRLAAYGLILPTSWEEDVSPEPGPDGVHHLLHDARVVALDAVAGAA